MLKIFAVNATIGNQYKKRAHLQNRHGFKFPVLLDMDGVAGIAYKVFSLPTTFFVNKEWNYCSIMHQGVLPPDQLEEKFRNN